MNEGLKSAATTWTQCVDLLTVALEIKKAKANPLAVTKEWKDLRGHVLNLEAELSSLAQCVTKTVALMDEGNPAKVEDWTNNSLMAAHDTFLMADGLAHHIRKHFTEYATRLTGPWA